MRRAVIAIGCSAYEHMPPLPGAEIDARRIFDELTKSEVGNYDPARSILLLSPTLADVNAALRKVLFDNGKLETLTVFFAGHGEITGVGFYMGLSDTRGDRLSSSGLWLSQLLSLVAEAGPAQTNIILDACFSGGLAPDLSVLTRPETLGDAGSPAIILLAMAARNQAAGELDDGGFGTNALLDCVRGQAFVQDHSNALDLLDIGRVVTQRVKERFGQNPCLSALNVNQRSIFCRNPNFQLSAEGALAKWEPRAFMTAIEPVLAAHASVPADLIADIERLHGGLVVKASTSADPFLALEIRAAGAVALLEYCGVNREIDAWMIAEALALSEGIRSAMRVAVEALQKEQYALLAGRGGGLSNLFYLPVRISKLLGWAGAAFHLDEMLGRGGTYPTNDFRELARLVVQHYHTTCVIMGDVQAPYLALAFTALASQGMQEEGEAVLSSMFNSVVEAKGQIADAHIDPERVPHYLVARYTSEFTSVSKLIARPSETIVVLLKAAPLFDLSDVFDEVLDELDHVTVNAFIADDFSRFAQATIDGGENASFMVGHDIWTIADLEMHWPNAASIRPANPALACGAIMSALIFPDRVPWFVFPASRAA